MAITPDDLVLEVAGLKISGWESIRVSAGIERCPNDFAISMTERFPGELDFTVVPGDRCVVYLGADRVLSGHVDALHIDIGQGHAVAIKGRGRCADLVDCAAEWPGGQIRAADALGVAQKLCAPYGIRASGGDGGIPIPQMMLNLGETAFDIIERVCRFSALLVYESTQGDLILGKVGTQKAASGFQQGINVERASITYRADQQYSEYMVVRMAMDVIQDAGDAGNLVGTVTNPNIKRHRRKIIVSEGGDAGSQVAQQRAEWECVRRYGRAAVLTLTTDSWRDASGVLYTPNTLVDLMLPALKINHKAWLISEVVYRRDQAGTHCDLTIMPPEAFVPQPILLQPAAADVPFLPRKQNE